MSTVCLNESDISIMRVKKRSASLSLSHQAYDLIRTGILKGQFPMGAPLSRRQLGPRVGHQLPASLGGLAATRKRRDGREPTAGGNSRARPNESGHSRSLRDSRGAGKPVGPTLCRESQLTGTRGAAPNGGKTGSYCTPIQLRICLRRSASTSVFIAGSPSAQAALR